MGRGRCSLKSKQNNTRCPQKRNRITWIDRDRNRDRDRDRDRNKDRDTIAIAIEIEREIEIATTAPGVSSK